MLFLDYVNLNIDGILGFTSESFIELNFLFLSVLEIDIW
jgi:hypothetical protein